MSLFFEGQASDENLAIEMKGISKSFGSVQALKDVDLTLKKGEILALLGENGSGKTTLMNMLSGIYYQDSGQIFVDGLPVTIAEPADAAALNIGMIHQHFKLVEVLTVAENIVLGMKGSALLDRKTVEEEVGQIIQRYGFQLEPSRKVYELSVSEKQTAEIVKTLYRGADILILDEPTAVLTPQETDKLFEILRQMKDEGKSIIIITHKLNEVMAISDRVQVLRKGINAGVVQTKEATEALLVEMMVGRPIALEISRTKALKKSPRLIVKNLQVSTNEVKKLKGVSFDLYGGEILGVAGISGSGQKELCDAIYGLVKADSGTIHYYGKNGQTLVLSDHTTKSMLAAGARIGYVPEDRLGMGLIGSEGITENVLLKNYRKQKGLILSRTKAEVDSNKMITALNIQTPSTQVPVRRLSGGNIQKVLLGREIGQKPDLLIVSYPVRGLDMGSSYQIYDLLNDQKAKGVAVLFIGEDLDVLMQLSDRLLVLCDGQVTGIVNPRKTSRDIIGRLMSTTDDQEVAG